MADFYVGFLLPDGDTLLFFTGRGGLVSGSLANLASFTPVATAVALATPFSLRRQNFFSHLWAGTEPRGRYVSSCSR